MEKEDSEISLGGNIWKQQSPDEFLCRRIAETYDVSPQLARLLCLRNVAFEHVESFLNPKIQNLMPDPYVLKDMKKAAERVAFAIQNNEKIGIIGDYDVDGATSVSELVRFFRFVGVEPMVHIPSREEGYGPNDVAFKEFENAGAKLVLTIDCGTTAFEVLDRAAENGCDVIVIDHHEAEVTLPKVFAVINPKRLDEENDYPYLEYMSAVGVGFMFLVAVNRVLRNSGFYADCKEPNLFSLLDLVALGTVCDVVPLRGLNRAYVCQGLKVLAQQQNIGLKSLMKILKFEEAPTAYHLGFVLGPRINACGRVGDATLGSKLLCSDNLIEAEQLAEKFNQFNVERKEIENYVLLDAIEQIESSVQDFPAVFVFGNDWHQGVIGIVAGRLRERYNVPAFVMSVEEDEVKGSARSVSDLDLGALIMAAKERGVITSGGGHMMAAGFSLSEEQIPAFRQFVGEYILEHHGKDIVEPVLNIDLSLSLGGLTEKLAVEFERLAPYGTSNEEPLICLQNVGVSYSKIVGSGHVKCTLSSAFGGSVAAIAFRCADNAIGQALLNGHGEMYDMVGQIKLNNWQGKRSVQFVIQDMKRK